MNLMNQKSKIQMQIFLKNCKVYNNYNWYKMKNNQKKNKKLRRVIKITIET